MQYQRKISRNFLKFSFYAAFIALFIFLIFSCSNRKASPEYSAADSSAYYSANEDTGSSKLFLRDRAAEEKWSGTGFNPEGQAGVAEHVPAAYKDIEASATAGKSKEAEVRKKILSGGCTIRTASAAAGIVEISSIAEKYKGWIESSSDKHVAIRVPAGNFRKAFDEILRSGEIVDKYEEADDVTDQYSDLSTRLDVLKNARVRLENLLAAETDTEKKVPILREIKRIDDQIERLQANLEYLDKAIAYSTITVNFVSYNYTIPYENKIIFSWIDSLDPFSATIPNIFRKIIIPIPDDFAILRKHGLRYFHAETADGTVIRIGTVRNNPEADSSFWQKAIIYTIGSRFSESTEVETGNIKYVLFKPKSGMDYRYIVGTVIKRKLIYVVEVYFPDSKSYEKWIDSVNESLGEIKIK